MEQPSHMAIAGPHEIFYTLILIQPSLEQLLIVYDNNSSKSLRRSLNDLKTL
ncbi:hypothetical protein D3C73_1350290 [compost metagenome]